MPPEAGAEPGPGGPGGEGGEAGPAEPPSEPASRLVEVTYDDYHVWKRNAPSLYETCVSHVLAYPCLALDFLPAPSRAVDRRGAACAALGLALGTNTPAAEPGRPRDQNYLLVKELLLPPASAALGRDEVAASERGLAAGGYGSCPLAAAGALRDLHWLPFPSEVNAVAVCPHDRNLVLALSNTGLLAYNLGALLQRSSEPSEGRPAAQLPGIEAEGFALEFSPTLPGRAAAGDSRGNLCVYDARGLRLLARAALGAAVNGLSLSPFCPDLLACALDDGRLLLLRLREGPSGAALEEVFSEALPALTRRSAAPTAVAFSPFYPDLLALADEGGLVYLLDLRCLSEGPLRLLRRHSGPVYQLRWSPFFPGLLATGSEDRRVCLWDLSGRRGAGLRPGGPGGARGGAGEGPGPSGAGLPELVSPAHAGPPAPSGSASGPASLGPASASAPAPAASPEPPEPPELAFVHAGHTTFITALCWHPTIPNLIASAAEDNTLQFWWPSFGE